MKSVQNFGMNGLNCLMKMRQDIQKRRVGEERSGVSAVMSLAP